MTSNLPAGAQAPAELFDPQAASRDMLRLLARHIASEIESVDAVLNRLGLTQAHYEKIINNPYYKRCLLEETREWHSPQNIEQRSRLAASFLHEQLMPNYAARLSDRNEPLPAVNEGMKNLAKWAGIGETKNAGGTGEKFTISINIPGEKPLVREVQAKTIEHEPTQPQATGGTNGQGNAN
jgi:hypothetical protein